MAGNSPSLPADTRSREFRIVLMPDYAGAIEHTYWWLREDDVMKLAERITEWADSVREQIPAIPVDKPSDCHGRAWEKWRPLLMVAMTAGGRWPDIAMRLIKQDLVWESGMQDDDYRPRAVVLLEDLRTLWQADEEFLPTEELLRRLMEFNKAFWTASGDSNPYGKDLTAKGLRNMIANAAKLTPRPEVYDATSTRLARGAPRGYFRKAFVPLWERLNERVSDPDSPLCPGASGASGVSGAEDAQSRDSAPDTSDAPDAPGHRETPLDPLAHSLIEYCMDCGTELTEDEAAAGSYCRECLDDRESR